MAIIDAPPAPPVQHQQSAIVADISDASAATVAAWKRDQGVVWWVELGDQLLLVGEKGQLRQAIPDQEVLGEIPDLQRSRLRLHARGCTPNGPVPGKLIAQGGRWELREFSTDALALSLPNIEDGHADEWQEVLPNSVIAQLYRPEAPRLAADPLILPLVNSVDSARWFANLSTLADWDRSSYGTELALSRVWIESRFSGLGLAVSAPAFTMPASGGGGGQITVNNVLGMWTGTQRPDEWIIVGGHYDSRNTNIASTVNTPGAEDNASGCAGVIEMAHVLVAFKPERSVLFMCYAGEEQGLYGSKAHVQALQAAGNLVKVQAMVNLDMIGYSFDTQLDVLFESNSTWTAYLNRFAVAAATYVPELRVTLSTNAAASDHVPYLNAGKQALLAIENDWHIYPHYHRTTDIPANLQPNAQAMGGAILKTSAAVLADLAGASDRIFSDDFDAPTP